MSRVKALLTVAGVAVPSTDTGGESIARKRFSFGVLEQLLRLSASALAALGEAGTTRFVGDG